MPDSMLAALRWWAELLDSRFRVPGTQVRFGLDPILSLVPGLGDLASPVFTLLILGQALRQRVPRVVIVRMVLNALIDAAIGVVPIAGNIGDVFWRANLMNLALLERHARPGRPPAPGDYAFVWAVAALFGLAVAVPVLLALWLAVELWRLFQAK
jgi:Domain of unknown function (DUF4112)